MPKAVFVAIVFAVPALALLMPADWFQEVWVPIYAPFGLVMALITYFRPRSEMFLWIFSAPVLFWLLLVMVLPVFMGASSLSTWAQALLLVAVVATPIGLLIGAFGVLGAMLLFALFRSRGWLE